MVPQKDKIMKEMYIGTPLIEAFSILGELVGNKGSISIGIKCEDGYENNISWKGKYSIDSREQIMVRALRTLYDVAISQRENNDNNSSKSKDR